MSFTEKWKLVRIFQLWCDHKNIPKTPYNFIQFLLVNDFIDAHKIREYLKIFKTEDLLK